MSDDLRVRVADLLRVNSAHNRDRAIAIVWNEAIEIGEKRLRERGDCCWPPIRRLTYHEAADTLCALRKPEEGG